MQNNCINVRNVNNLEFEVYSDHIQTYTQPNWQKNIWIDFAEPHKGWLNIKFDQNWPTQILHSKLLKL